MSAPALIQTYTVEVANTERNEGFTVELIATSEQAAISRTRGALFHRFRDVSFMDPSCAYTVVGVEPFVPAAVNA